MKRLVSLIFAIAVVYAAISSNLTHADVAKTSAEVPAGKAHAMIDLGSASGVKSVKGEWRYSDTKIVEADFRGALAHDVGGLLAAAGFRVLARIVEGDIAAYFDHAS